MRDLIKAYRLTAIVDSALQSIVLDDLLRLGAKGFTLSPCTGVGRHQKTDNLETQFSRVRIEVVAIEEIAEKLMEYLHKKQFGRYPVIAYLDTINVHKDDNFF